MKHVVPDGGGATRLDSYLHQVWPDKSRSAWQKQVAAGLVLVNGNRAKPSQPIKQSEQIEVSSGGSKLEAYLSVGKARGSVAANIEVPVLFKNNDIIVVNKPAGLLTHPTDADPTVDSVAGRFSTEVDDTDKLRPGIVHRLDKDTSGVMILARNPGCKKFLQSQFRDRKVGKTYTTLVWGRLKNTSAQIELPLQKSSKFHNKMTVVGSGKEAVTRYKLIKSFDNYSLLEVKLVTGRMHQIRVHFAHLGHPVVGDAMYGKKPLPPGLNRQFVHASKLECQIDPKLKKQFEAPLAADLTKFLETLVK